MNVNKNRVEIALFLCLLIILTSSFSGCIGEAEKEVHVSYELTMKNPNGINYSISVPTLVMGNNKYNTPVKSDLDPIVNPEDYNLESGQLSSSLNYKDVGNATLLNINSDSITLKLKFEKDFDGDKHKFKNEKYSSIYPFPNSYYNQSKYTTKGDDKIGIIYQNSNRINVTINYHMSHEANDVSVNGTFDVSEEGFQMKPVYFEWTQTP